MKYRPIGADDGNGAGVGTEAFTLLAGAELLASCRLATCRPAAVGLAELDAKSAACAPADTVCGGWIGSDCIGAGAAGVEVAVAVEAGVEVAVAVELGVDVAVLAETAVEVEVGAGVRADCGLGVIGAEDSGSAPSSPPAPLRAAAKACKNEFGSAAVRPSDGAESVAVGGFKRGMRAIPMCSSE